MEHPRIAVVDDERDILSAYSMILMRLGYPEPSKFVDGTSLVNAMGKDKDGFDLILMDYRMPEMNGVEAAKIIHRHRPKTKIIIVTAYDIVEPEALANGFMFLKKPVSTANLGRNVREALR